MTGGLDLGVMRNLVWKVFSFFLWKAQKQDQKERNLPLNLVLYALWRNTKPLAKPEERSP